MTALLGAVPCPECTLTFPGRGTLSEHLVAVHVAADYAPETGDGGGAASDSDEPIAAPRARARLLPDAPSARVSLPRPTEPLVSIPDPADSLRNRPAPARPTDEQRSAESARDDTPTAARKRLVERDRLLARLERLDEAHRAARLAYEATRAAYAADEASLQAQCDALYRRTSNSSVPVR